MIALIVAYAENRVIGNKGIIPWTIPGEQRRFRELTTNQVIVMGRRTYEEIGRPLPNRITIVVSTTQNFDGENCYTVNSLEEAIILAKQNFEEKNIYISGGARLYKESLSLIEKMYITEIDLSVEGDTFFPEFDENLFVKEIEDEISEPVSYRYVTYSKKQK